MEEIISTSEKFWRTLVRVEKQSENFVYFIIPAWDAKNSVCVFKRKLPKEIQSQIEIDKRFFVQVNLGVEQIWHLQFKDWEIE